jgi:hypothetical protein
MAALPRPTTISQRQVARHHQLQDPSASSVIRTVAGVPGSAVASSSDLSGTRALARKRRSRNRYRNRYLAAS